MHYRNGRLRLWLVCGGVAFLLGCAAGAARRAPAEANSRAIPSRPRVPAIPPAPLQALTLSTDGASLELPPVVETVLDNGLRVRSAVQDGLPLVRIDLAVLSGSSSDAEAPGASRMVAAMIKQGGAGDWTEEIVTQRIESLGSSLVISARSDATIFTLTTATQHLPAALELLATLVRSPHFRAGEFARLKSEAGERVDTLAKTSGAWLGSMLLYREVFALSRGTHPYSRFDLLRKEIEGLSLKQCTNWYQEHFVPSNVVVLTTGATSAAQAVQEVQRTFGEWDAAHALPARVPFPSPSPAREPEIHLVNRPESIESTILVGVLGPSPHSDEWPAFSVIHQMLGEGAPEFPYRKSQERPMSLETTGSRIASFANGPSLLVLSTTAPVDTTGATVEALLQRLERIATEPAPPSETETIRTMLASRLLTAADTTESLASMNLSCATLGVPGEFHEDLRRHLLTLPAETISKVGKRYLGRSMASVVVAGPADVLAPTLCRRAPVIVHELTDSFAVIRHVPQTE